jgi:LEA14-like dessication related protein
LQFTLNLNVKNPNYQTAILNGLQYALEIDNVEMTTGAIDSKMQIATGQIAELPVNLSFDLKKALSGQSADAVKNMAFNFVGLGDKPSNVTVRLKPTLVIGGQTLVSPAYIPVSFTYGKNNK